MTTSGTASRRVRAREGLLAELVLRVRALCYRDAVTISSTEALLQCVVSLAGALLFEEFLPSLRSCGIKVMPSLEERREISQLRRSLRSQQTFKLRKLDC